MQKPVQQFKSQCEKAVLHVDNDMPLGTFYDFLMSVSGMMVDRMRALHQEQTHEVEEAKKAAAEQDACKQECQPAQEETPPAEAKGE